MLHPAAHSASMSIPAARVTDLCIREPPPTAARKRGAHATSNNPPWVSDVACRAQSGAAGSMAALHKEPGLAQPDGKLPLDTGRVATLDILQMQRRSGQDL